MQTVLYNEYTFILKILGEIFIIENWQLVNFDKFPIKVPGHCLEFPQRYQLILDDYEPKVVWPAPLQGYNAPVSTGTYRWGYRDALSPAQESLLSVLEVWRHCQGWEREIWVVLLVSHLKERRGWWWPSREQLQKVLTEEQ